MKSPFCFGVDTVTRLKRYQSVSWCHTASRHGSEGGFGSIAFGTTGKVRGSPWDGYHTLVVNKGVKYLGKTQVDLLIVREQVVFLSDTPSIYAEEQS